MLPMCVLSGAMADHTARRNNVSSFFHVCPHQHTAGGQAQWKHLGPLIGCYLYDNAGSNELLAHSYRIGCDMGPDVIAYVQVAGKVLVSPCLDNNEDNNYCIRTRGL